MAISLVDVEVDVAVVIGELTSTTEIDFDVDVVDSGALCGKALGVSPGPAVAGCVLVRLAWPFAFLVEVSVSVITSSVVCVIVTVRSRAAVPVPSVYVRVTGFNSVSVNRPVRMTVSFDLDVELVGMVPLSVLFELVTFDCGIRLAVAVAKVEVDVEALRSECESSGHIP